MTDKIQKIREWVKARLNENASKQSLPQFYGMMEEDARFLDFIDSLQEEPVNNGLDLGCGVIWKDEEPVSKGLEKEIQTTIKMVKYLDLSIDDIVSFCAHHYSKWQKEQMMAKAVNAKASYTMSVPSICISLPLGVNVGDKVKVIVIKED